MLSTRVAIGSISARMLRTHGAWIAAARVVTQARPTAMPRWVVKVRCRREKLSVAAWSITGQAPEFAAPRRSLDRRRSKAPWTAGRIGREFGFFVAAAEAGRNLFRSYALLPFVSRMRLTNRSNR